MTDSVADVVNEQEVNDEDTRYVKPKATKKHKRTEPPPGAGNREEDMDMDMSGMMELFQSMADRLPDQQQQQQKKKKHNKRLVVSEEDEEHDSDVDNCDTKPNSKSRGKSRQVASPSNSDEEGDVDQSEGEGEDFQDEEEEVVDLADIADNVIESLEGLLRTDDQTITDVLTEGVDELKKLNKNLNKLVKLYAIGLQS